ncbi:MAG: hypothetical protein LBE08_13175, partial [Bifidobacteriaceae bacterium]|nr:hypothetical protein [Bifidobacteriaceae bacterium]
MKTSKRWVALGMAATLCGAVFIPASGITQASAALVPVEVSIAIVSDSEYLPVIDLASPSAQVKLLNSSGINDGSGSLPTEKVLPLTSKADGSGYVATSDVVIQNFDPDDPDWSYSITGLDGYVDVTGGSFVGYDPQDGPFQVLASSLTVAAPRSYTLLPNPAVVPATIEWSVYYEDLNGDKVDVTPAASIAWSNDFPELYFTAEAVGEDAYLESFEAAVGFGPYFKLPLDIDPVQQVWPPAGVSPVGQNYLKATAAKATEQTTSILTPSGDLTIPGFNPTTPTACKEISPPSGSTTTTYQCKDTSFKVGAAANLPPAIWPTDSTADISADGLAGTYGPSVTVPGLSTVKGVYYTQKIVGHTRTIEKWSLQDDFKIVAQPFQVVQLGPDADVGDYTVSATLPNGVAGYCHEDEAGFQVNCWAPEGTPIEVKVIPAAGKYLESVTGAQVADADPLTLVKTAVDLSDPSALGIDGSYTFELEVPATPQGAEEVTTTLTATVGSPILGAPVSADALLAPVSGAPPVTDTAKPHLVCASGLSPYVPCTGLSADADVVALTSDDSGTATYWATSRTNLTFALVPGDDFWTDTTITDVQVSLAYHAGYAAQLALAVDDPVAGVYVKTIDINSQVKIYWVDIKAPDGTAGSFMLKADAAGPGFVVGTVPTTTNPPLVDASKTESWQITGLKLEDAGSGVRALVWAKLDPGDAAFPTGAAVIAESVNPMGVPTGNLGTCDAEGDGTYTCDIAHTYDLASEAGSFDVTLYSVDNSDNITPTATPLTFYYDQVGPVLETAFSVLGCDAGQATGADKVYCSASVNIAVEVKDEFIGFSAASPQDGHKLTIATDSNPDGAKADESHGALRLSYTPPGNPPQTETRSCVLDNPDPDDCSVTPPDAGQTTWQVTFFNVPKNVVSGTDQIYLDSDLTLEGWDLYGNRSAVTLDHRLEVENVKPKVTFVTNPPVYEETDGQGIVLREWYRGTVLGDNDIPASEAIGFDAQIVDCLQESSSPPGTCLDSPKQAGLREYEYKIGTEPTATYSYGSDNTVNGDRSWIDQLRTGVPNTDTLTEDGCTADGECKIEITPTDRAGNTSGVQTKSVWVDRTAPQVEAIAFGADPNTAVNWEIPPNATAGYQHFSQGPVTITVTVSDLDAASIPGAGAKAVSLYLQDLEAGETRPTLFATERVTDGQATFTLPASSSFKGIVSATVVDNVGNQEGVTTGTQPVDATVGKFYAQGMLVVESATQHRSEAHINSTFAAVAQGRDGTDADNLPLFAAATGMTLTATDTYAGIKAVRCSYTTELKPDPQECVSGSGTDWVPIGDPNFKWTKKVGDGDDSAAWTVAELPITISEDSNKITVNWCVRDRAGYETCAASDTMPAGADKRAKLSIDRTAPTATVTWNSVSPDPENGTYYRNDRIATFVVQDRNVTASRTDITTGGAASGWTQVGDTANWTYRATVSYTQDADYRAASESLATTDLAGNSLAPVLRLDDWTLDKTPPVISIAYDNNAATNSNFYGAARTATITVQEHNFQASRLALTETSALANGLEGAVADFAWQLGAWNSSGDTHTASLRFASDGRFAFAATVADMAGNEGAALGRQEFYIDQTKPEIKLLQVPDGA